MAVSRAKKSEQVEKLGAELKKVSSMIVATYGKLTVAQDYELRKALRSSGAKYRVVKNTLAERAAQGTNVEEALKNLSGVTSIAYTEGDPVALAKALSKYAKDNPEFTFKTGIVEGRVISINEIKALATMPSKEEIYSKLPQPKGGGKESEDARRGGGVDLPQHQHQRPGPGKGAHQARTVQSRDRSGRHDHGGGDEDDRGVVRIFSP